MDAQSAYRISRDTLRSTNRSVVVVSIIVLCVAITLFLGTGRSQPTASNTHDKSDREKIGERIVVPPPPKPEVIVPRIPMVMLPDDPPPSPVPEIRPAVPSDDDTPLPAKHRSVQRESNICTKHGGWKVETSNGKSWRCKFRKGNRH